MEIVEVAKVILPLAIELIKVLRGQPLTVKLGAAQKSLQAAKDHCDGIGCAPDTVTDRIK